MPFLFRIIRGVEIGGDNVLPLDLRRDFALRPGKGAGGNGGGKTEEEAAEAEEALALARSRAEEIIARARAEAEKLMREAHEQALRVSEELARQAEAEGFRKGYEKGRQEGLAQAEAEGQSIRREAGAVLRQAGEIWKKTVENMENEIVSLAREIAEKILAAQLTLDPAVVLAIVREALELARNREHVVLYVNPAEVDLVEQNREELLPVLSPQAALHIIGDAGVERGGCRVETEDRTIEATLKERWRAIQEALQA